MKYKTLDDLCVIVLAAGSGTRTELKTPKQYVEIGEKKVIEYSLSTLSAHSDEVIVVVPDVDEWNRIGINLPIKVVKGGATRTQSLLNGLAASTKSKVLIHDASRPLVPDQIVITLHKELDNYASVYPVLSIRSTIVIDQDGFLQATPDRDRIKEIQTPQGFQKKWLKKALQEFGDKNAHIPELIRWLGQEVKHIEGSPWLFKITYEPDIYAARVHINNMRLTEGNQQTYES